MSRSMNSRYNLQQNMIQQGAGRKQLRARPWRQRRILLIGVLLAVALGLTHSIASHEPMLIRADTPAQPLAQSTSLPAFPGAEGFGADTVGGRGGRVIEVTNLNDSGPGSLRDAIGQHGPRIIVFRVGGTIELQSRIDIEHPYITIAGQTAPGGGITLKNHPSMIHSPLRILTHDVVIRYIRSRPGPSEEESDVLDALTIADGYNIVIDHSSFSWGSDEVFNIWYDVHDVTIQWSVIAEGLHESTHPEGPHSNGMLIGSEGSGEISIHHNLFAHNRRRNPKVNMRGMADVVNNVIYNARYAMMIQDTYASPAVNYVGNIVIHGVNSFYDFDVRYFNEGNNPPTIYVRGNLGPKRPTDDLADHWVVRLEDREYLVDERIEAPQVTTYHACTAYHQVLADAGVTVPMRDAVDKRLVDEVINRTGQLLNDPSEVGGWPELEMGEAPADSDHDGMPDAWEEANGLDPEKPEDGAWDADGDGYTNVEEYLNSLASTNLGLLLYEESEPMASPTANPLIPPHAAAVALGEGSLLTDAFQIFLPSVAEQWSVAACDPTK